MSSDVRSFAMSKHKLVEYNGKVGYWTKGGEHRGKFVSLTNFCLKLIKYVKAPESLAKESGFLVEVSQLINGKRVFGYGSVSLVFVFVAATAIFTHRKAYLPWYRIPNADKLVSYLGSALLMGALVSNMSPSQTKSYLITLSERYFRQVNS